MHHEVTSLLKGWLLSGPDVSRLPELDRSTSLFSQGEPASALYFVEAGLIKQTRHNFAGGRLILAICGPNHLVGEESLTGAADYYQTEAQVLVPSTVYRIPWETVKRMLELHPDVCLALLQYILKEKLASTHRVELMCLQDVEHRVLYYLEQLAKLVKPGDDGGYPLPITQLELGDLVGATRETTSTTLNHLEKKGFVKLSRRLLTVYLTQSRSASASGSLVNSIVPL